MGDKTALQIPGKGYRETNGVRIYPAKPFSTHSILGFPVDTTLTSKNILTARSGLVACMDLPQGVIRTRPVFALREWTGVVMKGTADLVSVMYADNDVDGLAPLEHRDQLLPGSMLCVPPYSTAQFRDMSPDFRFVLGTADPSGLFYPTDIRAKIFADLGGIPRDGGVFVTSPEEISLDEGLGIPTMWNVQGMTKQGAIGIFNVSPNPEQGAFPLHCHYDADTSHLIDPDGDPGLVHFPDDLNFEPLRFEPGEKIYIPAGASHAPEFLGAGRLVGTRSQAEEADHVIDAGEILVSAIATYV